MLRLLCLLASLFWYKALQIVDPLELCEATEVEQALSPVYRLLCVSLPDCALLQYIGCGYVKRGIAIRITPLAYSELPGASYAAVMGRVLAFFPCLLIVFSFSAHDNVLS